VPPGNLDPLPGGGWVLGAVEEGETKQRNRSVSGSLRRGYISNTMDDGV
jgi:hypothetical protein